MASSSASSGPMRVGVVGCGNISDIYVANSAMFRDIRAVACADVSADASARLSQKFGLRQMSVDDLLAARDIDIVLNLTVPRVHASVSEAVLRAGKHVYSEKPLATMLEAGARVVQLAAERGLRVGSAPDTILGAGLQKAKQVVEEGGVGTILTGLGGIMSKGMEHWHPNPEVFYQEDVGPVLDIGPYYITALIALLGSVQSVRATGLISPVPRVIGAEGPKKGENFAVSTCTSFNAVLSFTSGANIMFVASWDVWRHGMRPIELYGTRASIRVPDPDTFGGAVEVSTDKPLRSYHNPKDAAAGDRIPDWDIFDTSGDTFGKINYPFAHPVLANYRSLGLAEMANAIRAGRDHRCSGRLALHALAVMTGIVDSARQKQPVDIGHPCAAPAIFSAEEARSLLAKSA